jgi:hypothetical protein
MTAKGHSRWGVGVVVVFAMFVAVMLGITGFLMTQDANLVTDTYYEKELRYQERIQAMERTRALGVLAGVEDGDMITFGFLTVPSRTSSGQITLSGGSLQTVSCTLHPTACGNSTSRQPHWRRTWRCRVQWTMRQEEYYLEQPFMVP